VGIKNANHGWRYYMSVELLSITIGLVALCLIFIFFRKKTKGLDKNVDDSKTVEKPIATPFTWKQRLIKGLEKSRQEIWLKISQIASDSHQNTDEIEEILYSADLPPSIVSEILEKLPHLKNGLNEIQQTLYQVLFKKMSDGQAVTSLEKKNDTGPKVIMIVGVNGVGKTTTIGKLATKLKQQGNRVLVGACDTFRAAAVDQLQVWCDRANVDMLRAHKETDPSGVAYDTINKAYNENFDFCLVDTAGRLHTATNLMDELLKIKRVMQKIHPSAPHEVILVLDAITGQNAVKQALEFHKHIGLTGLILTKCDGSAKAGGAVSIVSELKLPIYYVGVGESVEDLDQFNLEIYLKALLGIESSDTQIST